MAALLSADGFNFISSWSLFSTTPFVIEQNSLDVLYIGYCFYGGPLPYKPISNIDLDSTVSLEEANHTLEVELKFPTFSLINSFGFTKFSQNQLDALISICTTYRSSDYFELFEQSSVYKAIEAGEDPSAVSNLISTDLPLPEEVAKNPKKYGIFYDISERRSKEALLYASGAYEPCSGLNAQERSEGGKKIFF